METSRDGGLFAVDQRRLMPRNAASTAGAAGHEVLDAQVVPSAVPRILGGPSLINLIQIARHGDYAR